MFKPNEIERLSMALDEPMKQLEMRIMSDVVRRIRINGEITRSADWQLNRLRQLGVSEQEIRTMLQESLHISDEDMNKLYTGIIKAGYARDESLYEEVGKVFIPFEDNVGLQQLISAVADQTSSELTNITQSLGFAVRQPSGKLAFTPLASYYQQTLDGAMFDIASGAFDYNTVLKRVVKEMTNSGLRTVDYASGHSNRVDVAARRAVMTGLSQLTSKVNEDNAAALETDTYEISWHTGARPSHWWGGRWYKKDELVSICGLGDVTGLCGANCYHDYYPVVPGVSEPTYSKDELAELNRKEQEKVSFGGKEYNKYEATQRQRKLETTMRAQREEIKLLKEGGASEDDLIAARARYRATSAEYSRFSETMGIPQQRERVNIDGLGNIGQGKYTGGSGKESPVKVPPVGSKVTNKVTAEERRELLSRNNVDIADNAKSTKTLSVYEERTHNQEKIKATLHDVEEKRRSLDYEVGTVIDRKGNILQVFEGEEHSVDTEDMDLTDLIFTHNHPSGGCFSDGDISEMMRSQLLELRASTPQGTYFSLVRTEKAQFDSNFAQEYKKATKITKAMEQVDADYKAGKLTRKEVESRGFNLYVEYMSRNAEQFLEENAEKYGYIFTKGVI